VLEVGFMMAPFIKCRNLGVVLEVGLGGVGPSGLRTAQGGGFGESWGGHDGRIHGSIEGLRTFRMRYMNFEMDCI
jgi:hypothetical protein